MYKGGETPLTSLSLSLSLSRLCIGCCQKPFARLEIRVSDLLLRSYQPATPCMDKDKKRDTEREMRSWQASTHFTAFCTERLKSPAYRKLYVHLFSFC